MKNKTIINLLIIALISFSLNAGVNLKNGNFYISYTDVLLKNYNSAFKKITRTYNSKSTEIGLFGFGWGTKFETSITVYPDGTLRVKEYGAGGKTVYSSNFISDDLTQLMIDDLIEIMQEEGDLEMNPTAITNQINTLKNDINTRLDKWDKYVKKGLLEYPTDFPIGSEWESFTRGNQKITLTKEGFVRNQKNKNEREVFNTNGKLIKYDLGDGNFTILEYTNNTISKMITGDGTELIFETNKDGFVTKIYFKNIDSEKSSSYKYDDNTLIYNKDIAYNHYGYTYDENKNLTKILYNPVRQLGQKEDVQLMSYHPKTSYIKSITDRKGDTISYEYPIFYKEDGTKDDNHYATKVTKKGYNEKLITNIYEYFIGAKGNGETYSKKIITTINGIKTATEYDEICSKPIEISRGKHTTNFKYNNRCLLIEKHSTKGDSIAMKYHPTSEKLTYVKNDSGIFEFTYDENLNLTDVQKNKNQWVKLVYDVNNKITTMTDGNKTTGKTRTLTFLYNKIGKPIKIEMKDVGAINVTYDKYGEIERVASEDGHKMALQVTQAFQSLLQLVKPSGVNLNM
ncbi:hypothetical protein KO506_08275 [Polaribacter vadi]|uniref:DUF6531 domain-containing protein n=1 Tax=Polaribacter TaxID=52959 RepID=UPI001C094178|nr:MULTISPECIES: DUF6531 domain-containing protein [Polaribacter]MBU3011395.1 hypothetical protein [Polaribacter vadi]MDO6741207.1 DUF6531 domain-containing protein [Polaribacter sp. 1_MG-2023]